MSEMAHPPHARLSLGIWTGVPTEQKCRRVTLVCAGLTAFIAGLALVGNLLSLDSRWVVDPSRPALVLARLLGTSNHMVIATAKIYCALSAALFFLAWRWDGKRQWLPALLALFCTLWCLAELGSRPLEIVRERLPLVEPVLTWVAGSGMSILTAISFLVLGVGIFGLAVWPGRPARELAAGIGVVNGIWGMLIILAYFHQVQMLRFRESFIAMAFPTAIAMLAMSLGLIAVAGPDNFLLRRLTGSSARAVLLRTFLPVILLTLLAADVVRSQLLRPPEIDPISGHQEIVIIALTALGVLIVIGSVILLVANVVGEELDRAEKLRAEAMDKMREARDTAEAANQAKSQFVANMGHELRHPLNAVIGYAELLLDVAQERGDDELMDDLNHIRDSGKHLLALINDILDVSKIQVGRIELFSESFDVRSKVDEVANIIRLQIEKKGNRFLIDCPSDVGAMHTDPTRVKQCLLNLLSNAGKFTDDGTVTLQVRREVVADRPWVVFRVSDTGIGMTDEQQQRIFQAFVQVDASIRRRAGGVGLGLMISRSLAELMGGSITAESVFGSGTTFTMRLPAYFVKSTGETPRLPGGAPSANGTTTDPAAARPLVLIADDDPAMCDLLERILTRDGYRVTTVLDGQKVLPLARELRPAAITLDVMMPGMDGWSILSSLKADPELAEIPVIMITFVDDKNLGYTLGAADYLVKPIDQRRVLELLRQHCRGAGRLALIAEDDPSTRAMLRRSLESDGWVVVEAGNGREALERIAAQPPALIVLDLMMPGMDGFEFLEELRRHEAWRTIPVVVTTAKDLTAEDRQLLTGGMLLGGCVRRVLHKGSYSREDLLRETRELVRAGQERLIKI